MGLGVSVARTLTASLLALLAGLVAGHALTANDARWSCSSEDEVVVIDGTCRHIDTLEATP